MEILEFLRHFRVGGYAIFDFIVSFGGIYLLAPRLSGGALKFNLKIPRRSWVLWTLPIGILFHLVFQSITPLTRDFIDFGGHWGVKVVIVGFFISGFIGITTVSKK